MRYGNVQAPDIIDTTCELVHDKFIDDYTKLLLHLDNGVVDSAKNATVTNNNVTFSTTNKFGGYSGSFNGTTAYLTLADSNNWWFGNADFTIDFWVNFNSVSGIQTLFCNTSGNNQNYYALLLNSGHLQFGMVIGNVVVLDTDYNWSPSTATWYHLVVSRARGYGSTGWKFYINGTEVSYTLTSGNWDVDMPNYTGNFGIGLRISDNNYYLNGLIDEFRVSKGIARWTANFTPPTQSYDCPLDTQTKLLIHGGGPNNGTTFYDNSTTARTLTTAGNTKFDSSQYKHRVSSIRFDGDADYITAPDSADWDFGSGDLTWETWIRFNSIRSGTNWISGQYVVATSDGVEWYFDGANNRLYADAFASGGGTIFQLYADWTPSLNTWYHLAFVRSGNTPYIFVNGVSQTLTTPTTISGKTLPNVAATFDIGGFSGSGASHKNSIDGWIDELRISKGIARWTSDFTPPTAPYDSPLTQYVIDGLDGDTDKEYRAIVRLSSVLNGYVGLRFNNDAATNYGWQLIQGASNSVSSSRNTSTSFVWIGQGDLDDEYSLSDNVIYAKTGKVRTVLTKTGWNIQGTQVAAVQARGTSWNNTIDNITSLVFTSAVASVNNGLYVGTHIILLKKRQLTTGTKTGEIDPQGTTYGHWQLIYDNTLTAAKTNLMLTSQMDSYTKLLIHADGADASTSFYDFSNSIHAITANGNAQVDTAQSKFGGASALFDGTGDYLSLPDSDDWDFGTGDFTIDLWVRPNSSIWANQYIIYAPGSWQLYIGNDDVDMILDFYTNSGGNHFRKYTFSSGTWYHIAITRSGTSLRLFVNGVQQGATFTNSDNIINATALYIGETGSGSGFNGWLDEIRISKGIARWTANFTPPTRAYNELGGDRDVVYRLVCRGVSGTASAFSRIFPNTAYNTGLTDKGMQLILGVNATASAARITGTYGIYLHGYNVNASGDKWISDTLIYCKSGFPRVFLSNGASGMSGTTVNESSLFGSVWNNTTDNLKYILINNDNTSGEGIGSHYELWRLNL